MKAAAVLLTTLALLALPTTAASAAEVSATYSALGSGTSSSPGTSDVRALAYAPDGTLYAGGDFSIMGGVTVNGIARWNGTSWSALGSGTNGNVLAIAFDSSGNLYAGGDFTTAGGLTVNQVAKWDGTSWSALGTGTNGLVSALEFVGTDLYVGGNFTAAGGSPANRIAQWDGTTWSTLGSGTDDLVRTIESDGAGKLYVGGDFTTAGGVTVNGIAHWNGTSWSSLGSGTNGFVYDIELIDNALYVGGNFTSVDGAAAGSVAAWIPGFSTWNVPANSGVNYVVHAIASGPNGSVIAGGAFIQTNSGDPLLRLGSWDGNSWSQVGSGVSGTWLFDYVGVIANAPDGSLIIGGKFSQAGGITAANIARVRITNSSNNPLWRNIAQGVPLNAQGTCDPINDAEYAYGTGVTGGWTRAWQEWITDSEGNRVGGWGCSRNLRQNGNTWFIEGQ